MAHHILYAVYSVNTTLRNGAYFVGKTIPTFANIYVYIYIFIYIYSIHIYIYIYMIYITLHIQYYFHDAYVETRSDTTGPARTRHAGSCTNGLKGKKKPENRVLVPSCLVDLD